MTISEALKALEEMPDAEFNAFLGTLPARTLLLVRSGMCDWRSVLPAWYVKRKEEGPQEGIDPADIPF